jgi:hypothetical protein
MLPLSVARTLTFRFLIDGRQEVAQQQLEQNRHNPPLDISLLSVLSFRIGIRSQLVSPKKRQSYGNNLTGRSMVIPE